MAERTSKTSTIVYYIILIIFTIFYIIPFYVTISTSFKPFEEVSIATMWNLPKKISLDGFKVAFARLSPNLKNSLYLTIPATLISAMIGSINGFALSKLKFKYSNLIFALLLFGMFIPYQSVLFPLIQFFQKTGLYGTIPALIIAHVIYGIPITTLMFKNYYEEIPDELIEAASVDGANIWQSYTKILLPISMPGFVVVIIWQFTNIWNEFLFAVTVTSDPTKQPITVALVNLAGSQVVEWNVQMAGALLAALPTLIVYILLGRYFVRGLLAGSVKG
ncbi:MAG: carbohydrate ABC transporter permease [Defluviitoga tunisiensis]|jgi:glucose/mannose transport system permease protein|uniref:ABC transporter permease n=1 Tax=Defluviitoga tunisiensis TaxID=1006576 RepID=A0A0C7P2W5_DEFTU|nr:carbohydrate ABC transporter permease [Defluviitoga tunisiensis]MDD3600129.1 carbohydrate ABC transporter permease [Defluviitoga tunisiensis]MDY0379243.1 carbohydrate ABC transporter permease [Defluviitoga tunisiensis]CEP78675.1 ABC transporter permease [Defluviitoga tunisiensis]HHV00811.1 carbohydrate ABC transporter permease [Defluviitoga tunisiensis]HOB54715.1 carbohydrate ABC transporter permease [Defluviitoga tunisiensis]